MSNISAPSEFYFTAIKWFNGHLYIASHAPQITRYESSTLQVQSCCSAVLIQPVAGTEHSLWRDALFPWWVCTLRRQVTFISYLHLVEGGWPNQTTTTTTDIQTTGLSKSTTNGISATTASMSSQMQTSAGTTGEMLNNNASDNRVAAALGTIGTLWNP